jgi:hypothetical protein
VSDRGPLARILLVSALLCGGVLAVAGGLTLRGPGLVGVGLAATLVGCTAAGIARETPAPGGGSTLESAVWAAGSTGGAVLVVVGITAIAGGVVAALAVGAGLAAFLAVQALRGRSSRRRRGEAPRPAGGPTWPIGVDALLLPVSAEEPASRTQPAPVGARLLPPVGALSTRALGEEWLRTTAALAGPLDPATRQSLVGRREEVLDELERRDPLGFTRWLAAGPARSDPADYVRGGPAHRGPVADTDAA